MSELLRKIIKFRFLLWSLLFLFLTGCGVNKHIPAGSYLLQKNKVEVIDTNKVAKFDKSEIKSLITQEPNTRLFGAVKLGMRIYCFSRPKPDTSWISKLFRKIGQEPVIYDRDLAFQSSEKMRQYLADKGSFTSTVEVVPKYKKKKATIIYKIYPSHAYRIREIVYTAEDTIIQRYIDSWKTASSLKPGDYYDLKNFSRDRDNIGIMLQNQGYYGFNKENIVFEIDTNLNNYELNVKLKVLNPQISKTDSTIRETHQQYRIKNVYIIPNSAVVHDSAKFDTTIVNLPRRRDTTFRSYTFLHDGKMKINPKTIARNIFISENSRYNLTSGERTYNSLSSLGNFKYLDIFYTVNLPKQDSTPTLNAWIRLVESKRNSASTSFDLTNTAATNADNNDGNLGFEWTLGYKNKNLFGNAEILNVKYRLFVQLPKNLTTMETSNFLSYFSTFETGINASLDFPKFLFPVKSDFLSRSLRPKTSVNAGYNYQYRSYYERSIPNVGFGYKWRGSSKIDHSLFPFEFNGVKIFIKDSVFQDSINNLTDRAIQYQYTDHLIMDAHYGITFTTQEIGKHKDFTAFSIGFESAGNLFYAIDKISGKSVGSNGIYEKMGIPYSQYIRMDLDLKHYFYFSKSFVFVLRGYFGTGFSYGNSLSMPYEKSFFGGGPTGVRAWDIRTLGPGSFQNKSNTLFDRTGDYSLCINIEQRFPIYSILEGAAFVDIGNIWLQRKSEEFPGGEFAINRFYKELGVGGGIGLRLNITFAIFRFDLGVPLRDPSQDDGERWRIKNFQFSDIVINFGIGYPF